MAIVGQTASCRVDLAWVPDPALIVLRVRVRSALRMAGELPGAVRFSASASVHRTEPRATRRQLRGRSRKATAHSRGATGAFFDYADEEVERIRQHGRKGALAAFRDAALFKVVYGWGLRRREAIMLDLADLHPNPTADRFGRYGALHVRWGKAKRGGAPRRRTVLAVFDWAVEALQQYVEEVRPAFGFTEHSALWVTERGSRLSARAVDERFATYRQALQFPPMLDLHSLRHSYVTHLVEAGFPERFVTDQVGHSWGSTTAIYCSVSDDYKNRILAKAVAGAFRSSPDGNVS